MEAREAAKNAFIFRTLQEEELKEVIGITREKRFHQGDVIMEEGEDGDTMYLMLEGEVGISKSLTMKFGDNDYRKTEKVLTVMRPENKEVFGEMALIGRDTRSASITARTDCLLLEIKRDDFIRMVEGSPALGVKLLLNLSELLISRLRQSSQDMIRLTTALSVALSK